MNEQASKQNAVFKWLKSTSNRSFILYPFVIILIESVIDMGVPDVFIWGVPLLPWGYLQFRLCGKYRSRIGGGGPGLAIPPERIVDTGIYAWTRNPMYLGHLIFMTGLAITFKSYPATALLVFHLYWFPRRVKEDEARLMELFGSVYEDYTHRVMRWIPGLF